ncbi:MAG: glycosyltransferase [Chloroflexota bacterium]|nr:glycosyltransferase [Chloroflexota bacterium]
MNIVILTAGSRGDTQPYIALSQRLQQEGYRVTLGAPANFEQFVSSYGISFAPLRADYYQLMDSPEGRDLKSGNPIRVMRQMQSVIFPLMRRLLDDCWQAAQGADAIIFHPKVLSAPHLAEKLNIPAIAAIPVPIMTPTAAFPAPGVIHRDLRGTLNRLTYSAIALATSSFNGIIGDWREQTLRLSRKSTAVTGSAVHGKPIPVLYPVSPAVIPVPADYPATAHMTGYWFTEQRSDWQPSAELVRFLEAGTPPVYVGFGSMVAEDTEGFSRTVLEGVRQSGQRALLASGWGGLKASALSEGMFMLDEAPHDWLFPRVAAVVHHGGAGTVAAGLRSGKPTFIVPFLADQPFWGQRLYTLGVSPEPVAHKQLTAAALSNALRTLVSNKAMQAKAASIAEHINREDGTGEAVRLIRHYVGSAESIYAHQV